MKLRLFSVFGIVIVVLSACRLPDLPFNSSSPGKSSPESAYVFAANPDPINVSVSLDESRRVEALMPVEGGTLTVQSATGTTFTLEIPGDALINETTVRMTPVTSLAGMPFGSDPLAVQLEPEGLFFHNFVTLTITPAQEIPVDQQILFGYKGAGEDVVLAPPVVDSGEIKIRLLHFSGYGVTKGLLADTEPVRQRIGGDAERRLQSQVAEVLGRERQRQLLGGSGESEIDWGSLFQQYEEQVVKPRVAAAGESCAAGRLALQTVLGIERQKQLLGVADESGMAQIADLLQMVSIVCVKEEYELCQQEHIIHRMVPVWFGLERQMQLLGVASDTSEAAQLAKDLTTKCLTFELQFQSDANFDDGDGGGYESVVKSKVKLQFDPGAFTIKGQAPLVNESFEIRVPGCSTTGNRGGGTFEGISLAYVADTHSPTDQLGYVRDFKFTYFPGSTSESFTVKCPDSPSFTSPSGGYWFAVYLVLHADELGEGADAPDNPIQPGMDLGGLMAGLGSTAFAVPPGTGFNVEDWEIFGNEYFAKKEWIKDDGGASIQEAGTFKLYHRPGQ
ncbi:MAG: hypothetical protein HY835_06290 [Anaerolineae bacterium]|nr:hypothetical protein [Anaerolineae bacterium]